MTPRTRTDAEPPEISAFPADSPLLLRSPTDVHPRTVLGAKCDAASGAVPLSGGMSAPVEFETEHFKGRIQVLFKRPPGLQAATAEELLRGKKRQIWVALQVCWAAPHCAINASPLKAAGATATLPAWRPLACVPRRAAGRAGGLQALR
jgi:hypothetical protein